MRSITDSAGAAVGSSTFDAFGARTNHTGTSDSLFGFTGNWTDPDTGLVHLRARDYDPATGQFLSVDPAVDSTKQPYAYAGNSPVQRTDPSGLDFLGDVLNTVVSAAQFVRDHVGCALEQVAAFGAGALDSLTFGASSLVLGWVVPGYNDFVAGHEAAFTAGSVTATVIQAVVTIIATAGAGAGLAIGLVVLKTVIKSAVKSVVKAVERTVVRAAERAGMRAAERSLPASSVRFSQSSVNGVADIEASMRTNGWLGDTIDVVRMPDGGLTTLDNTRLLAANRSGIDVQATVHGFDDALPSSLTQRFTTPNGAVPSTWGDAVTNRIGSQNSGFRTANPFGSWFTGWSRN